MTTKEELSRQQRELNFINRLDLITNGEIVLIGKYIDSKTHVTVKHITCGYEWTISPMSIRPGKCKCPNCQSQSATMTEEKFISKVLQRYKDEIEVIGKFKGYEENILIRRKPCNHEYEVQAKSLFRSTKSGCNLCKNKSLEARTKIANNRKFTIENAKNRIAIKYNDEYEVIGGEYVDSNSVLKYRHKKCGAEFEKSYKRFIDSKTPCNDCAGNRKYSMASFRLKYNDKIGDDFDLLGEYNGSGGYIRILHKTCNHEFDFKVSRITKGAGVTCPHCQSVNDYTFRKEIEERYGNEYDILTKYTSSTDKVYVRHNVCGYKWWVKAQAIKKGLRTCPLCSKNASRQERFMYNFLKMKGVNFEFQYSFRNEFRDNKHQMFDFYFPELNIALEIDGVQHYDDRYHRRHIDAIEQKQRDKDKNRYCLKHGIKMIRIFPYVFDRGLLTAFLKAAKIIR